MKKILFILNAAIVVSFMVWVYRIWDKLPEKIPVHFNFASQPDRWTGKGTEVIILVLMPLIMSLFLYGMYALSRKFTRLLNIPQKEKLLALPKEKQAPFWDMLLEFMAALSVAISCLFISIFYSMMQVAGGQNKSLSVIFWSVFIASIAVIVVYIIRLLSTAKKVLKKSGRKWPFGHPLPTERLVPAR